MRPATEAFISAVAKSHTLATEAVVIEPDGTETALPITDGNVTLDQTAEIRGQCDLTVVDDGTLGLVPTGVDSLLAPYGNEIRLSRGVTYPDGSSELLNLGVFRIQEVDVDDSPGALTIRIAGLDRSQRVADARFEDPYQIDVGTNYVTAILNTVQAAWPDVAYDLTDTALTTPTLVAQEGDDRWKFLQDMATALAMRIYFDGDGVLRLAPDVLTEPVAALTEGEGGVLVQAGRQWTREGAWNRVIATGENTGETAPARGVATDDNPLSPTYYYGPFGKVPRFYSSPLLITDAMAAAAAQTMLNNQLGTSETVNFGSFVLPYLEPGDTVTIKRARSGIDEDHILDKVTIPLAPTGTMTGSTRARTVLT